MNAARIALVAGLLAGLPALAQDIRFGLQAHVNAPMGDLKDLVDNKAGLGGGAHVTWDFMEGQQLRARVDGIGFPDATVFGVKNTVSEVSGGIDYLYFLEGKTGFYLTGGLSANRWKVEADVAGLGKYSNTTTKGGLAAGAGYAFNGNLSVEARFTTSKFDQRLITDSSANAFQVAALYRF